MPLRRRSRHLLQQGNCIVHHCSRSWATCQWHRPVGHWAVTSGSGTWGCGSAGWMGERLGSQPNNTRCLATMRAGPVCAAIAETILKLGMAMRSHSIRRALQRDWPATCSSVAASTNASLRKFEPHAPKLQVCAEQGCWLATWLANSMPMLLCQWLCCREKVFVALLSASQHRQLWLRKRYPDVAPSHTQAHQPTLQPGRVYHIFEGNPCGIS